METAMPFYLTSEVAWEKAAACAKRAEESFDDEARVLFERLRDRWIDVAQKFEFEEDSSAEVTGR
jgi:hypothetical protein